MAFPRSLDTKAISEYAPAILHGTDTLCPSFELAVAEEATEYYELRELSQVIFYTMLLNEAERLGEQALRSLESALTKLRWSAFESWIKLDSAQRADTRVFIFPGEVVENIGRVSSVPISLVNMAFPLIYNMREMADYRWRSTSHLPRPLLEDFHILCPRFLLSEAKGAVADFELPEIVQATFYAMLLNEAVELGVAHDFMAESMKSSLIGLRWSSFEVWMDCVDHALRGTQLHQPADEVEVCGSRDGLE
ncbi:LOW QUALITY PROTEIN: hypothetical protein Cgig2_016586 [Carnegiea gigantea]|uniref:Uncharacterized protein n=1 Tax=Carnegiea gigantea TaxID=171969 RepID=A0A9Q1KZN6_9CARY|nr:LOW QUALITY PROTEIN: hypothetical protein Cgig2_016586 [Carnegiea gigantea]